MKLPEWKDEAIFLLRLAIGVIFLMHGSQKVLGLFGGGGLQATVQGFQSHLGIPPVWGTVAAFTEFLGGLGLIGGLFTRLSALGIASMMGVAIWKVHGANGFFLNISCEAGKGHGFEYNVAILGGALALLLMGAGKYSLDRKIFQ